MFVVPWGLGEAQPKAVPQGMGTTLAYFFVPVLQGSAESGPGQFRCTMLELEAVFLYNLGGGFTEIRKVAYRYLQRQPDGRFVHLLVWLFNDEHVRVTFGFHRRLMPQHVTEFLVEVGRIPAGQPVAATPVQIPEPPPPETEAAMGNSEEDDSNYATSTASSYDA
ncbi:hypothetical protein PIB30_070346 [Stylosanthes scabra]|uniref:Uncharacterized protein n=1 Tax=Stylosanthes scabra TaxID=79078 RepID=A0ABU6XLY3_9FABA|nr:hypothetical protein [Stylosanthes scabra]